MKRRSFLKGTMATGFLVASGVPLLASCSGVKRSDLPVSEESAKGLDDESARILWYASLAPSGHNSQPWFVKVLGKGEWIVGAEPRRRLPAVDPDNRELLLSIGAFAENLSLAASAAGYESAIEVIAKSPRDEEVLRVSLKKTTSGTYPLERLTLRRTVKNGFLSKEIRNEDVKVLSEPHADRLFYYPRGTDHARCIQEGTVESYRAQTYRDDAQKELANWIRFSNAEARKHRTALPQREWKLRVSPDGSCDSSWTRGMSWVSVSESRAWKLRQVGCRRCGLDDRYEQWNQCRGPH